MAILGLLLLLSAAGLTLDVAFQNTSSINVDALGQTLTLSPGWLFVAGVITGAVALVGVTMLLGGMRQARRRRAALTQSRKDSRELQADRDRLEAELDRERAGRAATTSVDGAAVTDRQEPVAAGHNGILHRRATEKAR
jgi:hypothetical protein